MLTWKIFLWVFWIWLLLVKFHFLEILILIEWNKNVNFLQIFKIILINDDSFLHMYRSKMNVLTNWFLKIKWLFEKCLKIIKEPAIHKNGFSQSFRKNPVYGLVNFIGWTWPFRWTFFPLNLFALGLFCVKCPEEDSGFNHFKSYENHVNEFLYCQYSKMSYSYLSVQRIFLVPAYFW